VSVAFVSWLRVTSWVYIRNRTSDSLRVPSSRTSNSVVRMWSVIVESRIVRTDALSTLTLVLLTQRHFVVGTPHDQSPPVGPHHFLRKRLAPSSMPWYGAQSCGAAIMTLLRFPVLPL
jgi:hypothetical protein